MKDDLGTIGQSREETNKAARVQALRIISRYRPRFLGCEERAKDILAILYPPQREYRQSKDRIFLRIVKGYAPHIKRKIEEYQNRSSTYPDPEGDRIFREAKDLVERLVLTLDRYNWKYKELPYLDSLIIRLPSGQRLFDKIPLYYDSLIRLLEKRVGTH